MGRGGGGGGGGSSEALRLPNGVRDLVFRSRIGLGTFSTVKVATLGATGERVAVKCLSLPKIRALHQETNALRELRVLKAMSGIGALGGSGARHPLVVAVFGALRDGLSLYIVLELCGGGDLETRLDAVERFAEGEAQFYAGSIALGLAALHARGFCYRDLKPENVLLANDGSIRLSDFGLAIERRRTSTVCGSRHYMAPEIRTALSYDPVKSDWWAFGVCVCELLSGWTPFDPDVVQAPAAAAHVHMHERARGGGVAAAIHRVDPFALERNALTVGADDALDHVVRAVVESQAGSQEETPTDGDAAADATNTFAAFAFTPSARILITRLLDIDPASRMASACEVRTSSWFAGVRFNDLLSGQAPPPWVPAPGQRVGGGAAAALELALDGEEEEGSAGGDGGSGARGVAVEESDTTTTFARAWAWEAQHFANWQA